MSYQSGCSAWLSYVQYSQPLKPAAQLEICSCRTCGAHAVEFGYHWLLQPCVDVGAGKGGLVNGPAGHAGWHAGAGSCRRSCRRSLLQLNGLSLALGCWVGYSYRCGTRLSREVGRFFHHRTHTGKQTMQEEGADQTRPSQSARACRWCSTPPCPGSPAEQPGESQKGGRQRGGRVRERLGMKGC